MFISEEITNLETNNGWAEIQKINQVSKVNDSFEDLHTLIITGKNDIGFAKAAQSLLDENIMKTLFTQCYEVLEGKDLSQYDNDIYKTTTLRKLGVVDELTEGIGRFYKEIRFKGSFFGKGISSLELNLDLDYRPIQETEDVYLNIYIDDVLKHSQELDDTGYFNDSIKLENIELNTYNTIKVEYYYVPDGGFCIEDPATFYSHIDLDKSSLTVTSYYEKSKISFFYFDYNFRETTPYIYWDLAFNKENVETITHIINLINPVKSKNKIIYPKLMKLDKLESNIDKHNSIILTTETETLNKFARDREYLRLKDEKYDFRINDFEDYFKIDYNNGIGANQLFESNSLSHMYAYIPDNDPNILNQLVEALIGQSINNTGNLILADQDEAHFFDMNKIINNLSKKEISSNFDRFWLKYRVFIIFGLAVLLLVLLIHLFQRSKESKKNIVDDK